MSLDGNKCLGCLYLYPPGFRTEATKNADVDVSFWVTQEAYDRGLYPVLYRTLRDWLKTWPFRNVMFSNAEIPAEMPQPPRNAM
jgi:hypothetical protein